MNKNYDNKFEAMVAWEALKDEHRLAQHSSKYSGHGERQNILSFFLCCDIGPLLNHLPK
jgi:hypothetical protein